MRVHGEIDADFLRALIGNGGGLAAGERFEGLDRLANEAHVEIEAHTGNVAGLLGAKDVAGTAHLQVLHGYGHARTKVIVLRDSCQAVIGSFRERSALGVQEVGIAALAGAAHAPAQLMQLGQAHMVGVFHNEGIRISDIQAGFHDGGTYQNVILAIPETLDGLLEHLLVHLAMRDDDAGLRYQVTQLAGLLFDIRDFVVDEKGLTIAQQLAADGRGYLLVFVSADIGQHRVAVFRRGQDGGHLADASHRHLQGARNRCRGHGEHIHAGLERLNVFLVLHAKALLLVHDDEAEVLPVHTGLEEAVGADDDIDAAIGQPLEDVLRFLL